MAKYRTHTGLWLELRRSGAAYIVTQTGNAAVKTLYQGDDEKEARSVYHFWRGHYERRRLAYNRMACGHCGTEWNSEMASQEKQCPECHNTSGLAVLYSGAKLAKEIKNNAI